jgi:uncharacterized protein (TIGR02246 family)
MSEAHDQQQIRQWIAQWMQASEAGDLKQLLPMLAEDVVFLLPGREPMRGREGFAAASRAMAGKIQIKGQSDIQEIRIAGDYAFTWNYLTITITPTDGGPPVKRTGNILSVFRREPDGRWVLFRDANLLT